MSDSLWPHGLQHAKLPSPLSLGVCLNSCPLSRCCPGHASGKVPSCQCRRHRGLRFDSWVGKIPWRRKWQPTPGFFPGKSHGQRSLAGYIQSIGLQRVTHDWSHLAQTISSSAAPFSFISGNRGWWGRRSFLLLSPNNDTKKSPGKALGNVHGPSIYPLGGVTGEGLLPEISPPLWTSPPKLPVPIIPGLCILWDENIFPESPQSPRGK